jgi:Flp pilus assembly pilin Flp
MIDLSRLRLALLRRRAAGMVEYGALAALIAVAALGTVMMAGTRIGNLIERAADGVSPSFVWSGGGTFTVTSPTDNPTVVDRTFILTNTGPFAGTPEVPTVSGSGPGYVFSLVAHDCNRVLAAGETCSATVRAIYTANVAAATGTLGGPAALALTGSASGMPSQLELILSYDPVIHVRMHSGDYQGFIYGDLLLKNNGTSAVMITGYNFSATSPGLRFQNLWYCPHNGNLNPGHSCPIYFETNYQSLQRNYPWEPCGTVNFTMTLTVNGTVSGSPISPNTLSLNISRYGCYTPPAPGGP